MLRPPAAFIIPDPTTFHACGSMPKLNTIHLLEEVRAVAYRAGEVVMEVYATDFDVRGKQDASPVTLADERAEAVILEALHRLDPHTPVIAEEAVAAGHVPAVGDRFWLVDPLDGTKEFTVATANHRHIALVQDGVPYWGSCLPRPGRMLPVKPGTGLPLKMPRADARSAAGAFRPKVSPWSPAARMATPPRSTPSWAAARSRHSATQGPR